MTKLIKPVKKTKGPVKIPITLSKQKQKKDYYFAATLVMILALALIKFGLLDVPLERDEGEYAYFGQQLLDGIPPYTEAYNMKLPGTYFVYAIFLGLFGSSISAIHLGLLICSSLTILFLYLGFRNLFSAPVAFFAAAVYGLMSLSGVFLGFAAHATHFVALFLALGLFFFSTYQQNGKASHVALCGIMMGLSFLMKQQAVFYIVFGALAVLLYGFHKKLSFKKIAIAQGLYVTGAVLPYLLTVFFLYLSGAFNNFWFWTFEYASKYVTGLSWELGREQLFISFTAMWNEFKIFWIMFFTGIPLLFLLKGYSNFQKWLALSLLFAAVLTVVPGLYFRKHYFISALPAVGLFAAFALEYLRQLAEEHISFSKTYYAPVIIFSILFLVIINSDKSYYLQPDPNEISLKYYGNNPFVESPVIAEYIQNNTTEDDRIAVLGSEPQIYFYANRKSSTGYIYTYAMMENHDYNLSMQNHMIREIEARPPKFLIFCGIATSWLKHKEAPDHILKWYDQYKNNYNLEGVIDLTPTGTIYKWGAETLTYQPISQNLVIIFRKK